MKDKLWNIIFSIIISIILIIFIIHKVKWNSLVGQLKSLDIFWIIMSLLAVISFWLFEAKILQRIINKLYGSYKFKNSIIVTMVGQFFSAITPFATGGQPAQLYILTKQKIGVGKSVSILMIKFIIYQLVLVIFSLIFLIVSSSFFHKNMSNYFYLVFLGFIVDSGVIFLFIVLSRYKNLNRKIGKFILSFLEKINLLKNRDTIEKKINYQLDKFHENIIIIKNNKKLLVEVTILTVFRLISFYIIPLCIYKSFNLMGANLINLLAATSFVKMFISFIPVPGASGGAESSFYIFFRMFFVENNIYTAMLLWRIITYYSVLFIGFIIIPYNRKNIKLKG